MRERLQPRERHIRLAAQSTRCVHARDLRGVFGYKHTAMNALLTAAVLVNSVAINRRTPSFDGPPVPLR